MHAHARLTRSSGVLMDRLVGVLDALFDGLQPHSPAVHVTLHLLVWIDGSTVGNRPLTVAKIRILDPDKVFYSDGYSPVASWMECFHSESHLPTNLREAMLAEINDVYNASFAVERCTIIFSHLVLAADHKQLCILSGTPPPANFTSVPTPRLRKRKGERKAQGK